MDPFDAAFFALLKEIVALIQGQTAAQQSATVLSDLTNLQNGQSAEIKYIGQALVKLDALGALVSALNANLNRATLSLAGLIGQPQQADKAVILPSVPPAGYGGGATANQVWDHMEPGSSRTVGYWQEQMGAFALNVASLLQIPSNYAPELLVYYDYANEFTALPSTFPTPNFDVSTILSTDATVSAWLNRIDTSGWVFAQNAFGFAQADNLIPGYGGVVCTIDAHQFAALKAVAVAALPTAPVWPGLASVTLGATLALSDGLTVPGPLDGVIVHITSVAPPISFYPFGAVKSYVRAGALVFVDDNGDAEFPAPFGPDHEVICPRQIARAAHAVVRLTSGVVGTITPWRHV